MEAEGTERRGGEGGGWGVLTNFRSFDHVYDLHNSFSNVWEHGKVLILPMCEVLTIFLFRVMKSAVYGVSTFSPLQC